MPKTMNIGSTFFKLQKIN